jgi:hypothetical protein
MPVKTNINMAKQHIGEAPRRAIKEKREDTSGLKRVMYQQLLIYNLIRKE